MAPVVAIRGWRTRQGYDWVTDGRLVVSAGSADNAGHAVGAVACVVPWPGVEPGQSSPCGVRL